MNRHSSYDEDMARELQNPKFAANFLLSLMEGEDGLDCVAALKHTIVRMGVKEFSKRSKINPKSVSRMLASHAVPKLETIDQYLAPFGLRVRFVPERKAA